MRSTFFLAKPLHAITLSHYMVIAMFCLPFINNYHENPIPTFYNEWLAGVLGTLALWPIMTRQFWQSPTLPRISLLWLLLLLFSMLQTGLIATSAPHLPLIQGYYLWAFLITLLGAQLKQHLGEVALTRSLAQALLLATAINAGVMLLQVLLRLGFSVPIPSFTHYGTLAQSNHFANFVGLGMVSLLYLHTKQSIRTRWLVLGLLVGLVMLCFSGSRSGLLYLVAITLLSGWLSWSVRDQAAMATVTRRLFQSSVWLLPSYFALQFLINALLPDTLVQTPFDRAATAINSQTASLRWQFWQTSLTLFSQSPLFGMGIGQMRWQTFLLADQPSLNPAQTFFEHAHNLFLNVMAEMGLIGLLLVVASGCLWAIPFCRRRLVSLEVWWLLGCISIEMIHSMLEYPLWYGHFLGVFVFLLGMGESHRVSLAHFSLGAKKLLRVSLLAAGLYCVSQLALMQRANQLLEQQLNLVSQPSISAARKQAFVDQMLWVLESSLLAPYAELILAIYFTPDAAQAKQQLPMIERAVQFVPIRRPVLNLITLLAMLEQQPRALAHLDRLRASTKGKLAAEIEQLPPPQAALIRALLEKQNHPTPPSPPH